MEQLYNQIQVYLNMEEEISFEEFSDFYQKVIGRLGEKNDSFAEDDIWKGLFITENIMSNARARAQETKNAQMKKKYKKMAQRTELWAKNLLSRLYQLGYKDEEINERFEQMLAEEPNQSLK